MSDSDYNTSDYSIRTSDDDMYTYSEESLEGDLEEVSFEESSLYSLEETSSDYDDSQDSDYEPSEDLSSGEDSYGDSHEETSTLSSDEYEYYDVVDFDDETKDAYDKEDPDYKPT